MNNAMTLPKEIDECLNLLSSNGYKAFVVGGAVRDLLLGHTPKDYDISTAATPEQICQVFGRRHTLIIGKRFRLVHYRWGKEIIEISTFRKTPCKTETKNHPKLAHLPSKMIIDDNNFGSAEEDAFRRDFTVNALFYDPIKEEIIDYTNSGLADIQAKIVRVIGEPDVRFEEDPVRMLRALKLVGRFGFSMDNACENSLFANMDKIRHVPVSRMTLELEKVLSSCYIDTLLEAFHDFGLLPYFLPYFAQRWNTPEMERALDLIFERNCQVSSGDLCNSISLAMACLALPFIQRDMAEHKVKSAPAASEVISNAFKPQTMVKRLLFAAEKTVNIYLNDKKPRRSQAQTSTYKHAAELANIVKNVELQRKSEMIQGELL